MSGTKRIILIAFLACWFSAPAAYGASSVRARDQKQGVNLDQDESNRDLQFLSSGNSGSNRNRGSNWYRGGGNNRGRRHYYGSTSSQSLFGGRNSNLRPRGVNKPTYGGGSGGGGGSSTYSKQLAVTSYDRHGNPISTTLVGQNHYNGNRHYQHPVVSRPYEYQNHYVHPNAQPSEPKSKDTKAMSKAKTMSQPVAQSHLQTNSNSWRHYLSPPKPSDPTMLPTSRAPSTPSPVSLPTSSPTADNSQQDNTPTLSPQLPQANMQQQVPSYDSPVFNFDNFRPPKTVIEITPEPTPAPTTRAPSPPPTEVQHVKKSVETDVVVYETVGLVDLLEVEQDFFDHVSWLLTGFLAKHVGHILRTYKLTLIFLETAKVSNHLEIDDAQTQYHNVFNAKIRYDLEGSQSDLDAFTKADGDRILKSFFKGVPLLGLIQRLKENEIPIKMIREYDPENSPLPHAHEQHPSPSSNSDGGKSKSNVFLIVFFVFGLLILIAAIAFVCIKKRKNKRFHYYGQKRTGLVSPLGSVYSSSSSETGSFANQIKPAAIQKKKKGKSESSRTSQSADLDYAFDDPYPSLNQSSSGDLFLSSSRLLASNDDGDEPFEDESDPDFFTRNRPEEELQQTTLTNLDGEGSINGLDQAYPEFEAFVNMGPRASGNLSSNPQTEEYNQQRQQWHEESNDIDLIGKPSYGRP